MKPVSYETGEIIDYETVEGSDIIFPILKLFYWILFSLKEAL